MSPVRSIAMGMLAVVCAIPLVASSAREAKKSDAFSIEAFYPEGPTVVGKTLYWAEMAKDRVRSYDGKKVETVWQQDKCGPTAVRPTGHGDTWILCHLAHEIALVGPDWKTKQVFRYDAEGHRLSRPNDGKVDNNGTLYFSSSGEFDMNAPWSGYVVALKTNGEAHRIAGPFHYTNGITVVPGGKQVFVSEHLSRRVWLLDLEDGKVVRKSLFFDFDKAGLSHPAYRLAGPDGQYLGPDGDLYVAEYGGGRIIHIASTGTLLGTLPVKTSFITSMIPSPIHKGKFAVTGTYDNSDPSLRGAVFEIDISDETGH